MFQFISSFFSWLGQIFTWAYNTFVFQVPLFDDPGGSVQVITVHYIGVVIAFIFILIFTSVLWRSGKW